MSTPVVTNTWAGTFDCGTCRRKRLMGEEFSKKALERHRKDGTTTTTTTPLKCKQCVAAAEQAEREQAQARRNQQTTTAAAAATATTSEAVNEERRTCAGVCGKEFPQSLFNRNQWSKGEGKSRCRECVETAVQVEAALQRNSNEAKIAAAKENVETAKASGTASQIVAAESELAALEAEKVTGLKPVKLSFGRGRGRGSGGRGRGRGRSGGQGRR